MVKILAMTVNMVAISFANLCNEHNNIDFDGSDIACHSNVASSGECCGICKGTSGCGHWTWNSCDNRCCAKNSAGDTVSNSCAVSGYNGGYELAVNSGVHTASATTVNNTQTNISVNVSGAPEEAIAGPGAQLALRDGSKDDSATWVTGIVAEAFAEAAPQVFIAWVVSSLSGGAFSHKRTISVNVKTPSSMKRFQHWYNYADDGVQFVWEHTDYGLHLTYHDNGPISGCQAFYMDGCDHQLFVAASNPAVGHNKVRVAFGPSSKYDDGHAGGRTCYNIWDDMDSWGEHEGGAHLLPEWNHYDNPSTIAFGLDAVASCSSGSIIEV